jgi:hypothetical protein
MSSRSISSYTKLPLIIHRAFPFRQNAIARGYRMVRRDRAHHRRLKPTSPKATKPMPARRRQSPPIAPVNLIDRKTRQMSAFV